MSVTVAPSLYAAPLLQLGTAIDAVTDAGADALHLDIMDGHFVSPISFGNLFVQAVRTVTTLPLDVHLMVANPSTHFGWLSQTGVRLVTIHAEVFACPNDGIEACRCVRRMGMQAGIAVRPTTSLAEVEGYVGEVDHVLIMTVEPGASGQKFLPHVVFKISAARAMFANLVTIGVDGGITGETGAACVQAGADYLVVGSALFTTDTHDLRKRVRAFRKAVGGDAVAS